MLLCILEREKISMKHFKYLIILLTIFSVTGCKKANPIRTAPSSTYSALRSAITSVSKSNKPYIEVAVKIEGQTSSGGYTPIVNFARGDFSILENNDPVIIERISYSRAPISCVLVLDRSGSMGVVSDTASPAYSLNQAVKGFVGGLIDTDMVMLIDFGSDIKIRTGLTGSRKQLGEALDTAESLGMTSLWAAAGVGVDEMAKSPLSQKLLIVMTDGGDNTSSEYVGKGDYSTTVNEVIARALSKGVAVNCIGFSSYDVDLQNLASSTSGSFHSATSASDLAGIYSSFIPTEIDNTVLNYRSRQGGKKGVNVICNYGNLFTSCTSSYSD
jgi:hypothetical protein